MLDLKVSCGNVLTVKVSDRLTRTDYQELVNKLTQLMREEGGVRVLVKLENCPGWQMGVSWDHLKFGFKHGSKLERYAIVGNKKWHQWAARLSKALFTVKFFHRAEQEWAWQWVLGSNATSRR